MRDEFICLQRNHFPIKLAPTAKVNQMIWAVFCLRYLGVIALALCFGSVSFAQTRSDGATPAMTQPGAPNGSYALSGFENVNLFNGNLNFNLPLAKIGGRGKVQSSINLSIDSARWNLERTVDSQEMIQARVGANGRYRGGDNETLTFTRCNSHQESYQCGANPFRYCTRTVMDECYDTTVFDLNHAQPDGSLLINGVGAPSYSYYKIYEEPETVKPGYGPGLVIARGGKFGGIRNSRSFFSLVRIFFVTPDGTEIELRDTASDGEPKFHNTNQPISRGTSFIGADGNGIRFESDTPIIDFWSIDQTQLLPPVEYPTGFLYFPDGTKYRVVDGTIRTIQDIDGNKTVFSYNEDKQITGVIDSLGRQTEINYNLPANDPNDPDLKYDRIRTQKSSTEWQAVKIYRTKLGKVLRGGYELKNIFDLFPEFEQLFDVNEDDYNPDGVVQRVELPDGKSYKLFYTPYKEIARVELPTGGAFEYDFPMPSEQGSSDYHGTIFRPLKERRVYANGGSKVSNSPYNSRQRYVRGEPTGTYPNLNNKVTVEEYSGNVNTNDPNDSLQVFKTDHYFHGLANSVVHKFYSNWRKGREYKTETFDATINAANYGQLRSRSETEFENPLTVTWGDTQVSKHTRVKSIISTVFENGKSLTQKTTYGYDNTSVTNNKTDEWISDFGVNETPGRNLKHSKTYYLGVNPANSLDYRSNTVYLPALPRMSEVYEVNPDNSETLISRSEAFYDEAAYASLPSGGTPTGWTNPGDTPRGNATTSIAYNLSHGGTLTTHAQFDELGNPRKAWDARGAVSEVQYDAAMGFAFPTKSISAKPAPAPNPFGASVEFVTTTTYDFYTGLIKTATDANNQTAQTSYINPATGVDDLLLRPHKVTAPNGQQTVFEYGDQIGSLYVKVRKQIDGTNWAETTSYVDGLGRTYKTQTKDAAGDIFTETEFDNMGRVKRTTNPYRANETKLWSETRYDALGRAVETFAPKATGRGDSLGVTSFDLATGGDSIGTVVIGTDAAGRKGRSFTNALGQLIRVDEPSSANTLDPLPNPTPTPNPSPSPTPTGTPDPNPCRLPDPNDPCRPGESYASSSTYYKYDALGRMIEVTQGGQKRYFLYDTLGRLLRVRQPEQEVNLALNLTGHSTVSQWTAGFTYDANGNVKTATDAKNVTITNDYDQQNRVNRRVYSGEAAGQETPTVYFTYDGVYYDAGNTAHTAENPVKGALTQVRNGISTTQTTKYDVFGRPTEYQQITDGTAYTSKYAYNLSGALVEETYPSTRTVKNEFNSDGDLLRISGKVNPAATEKTYANGFSYTADGRIAKLKLGNGLWEAAKFNTRRQITELGVGIGADDLNKWKVNYEYGEIEGSGTLNTVKNTGNIARQTVSFSGLAQPFVQTYRYDSLNRLKEARETSGAGANAPQTWQQTFDYDQYGNRTGFYQKTGNVELALNNKTHPGIDPLTNRFLTSEGYGYDKNGNILSDPTNGANNSRSFVFNGDNKQTEVRDGNNVLVGKYFYDGDGKRVKKQTYDTAGEVKEITIFVYSGGKLVEEYSTAPLPTNPTTNYVATDILQSVRAISNALGEIISRRDFMPFGEELHAGIGNRSESQKYSIIGADAVRQKFTGYQKDEETNLDFAEARMYQNSHGRFTAVDPLLASGKSANPQTFNRYVYAMNRPLVLTDPSGMQAGFWTKYDTSENELPYAAFKFFNGEGARTTYNGARGTDFQSFNGQFYLYANQRYAQLNSSGVYSEGVYTGPEDQWNEAINLQIGGDTAGVDRAVINFYSQGRMLLIGSQNDDVTRDPLIESAKDFVNLFSRTPGTASLPIKNSPSFTNEFKMQRRHFEGTPEANKVMKNDGAVHLFNDMKTFSKVESQLFKSATFTKLSEQGSRNWARFGLKFDSPIGFRFSQDGTRTPLSYGEIKLDLNTNYYHIIPRTGPK